MSIHLILCAREACGLPASSKLLLLCMAENARDDRRIAAPGFEEMRAWSMLRDSQLYAALKPLYELRLLRQHRRGQKHVRAEYIVFPDGCCERHPAIPAPGEPDAEAVASASGLAELGRGRHSGCSEAETASCGHCGCSDADACSASGHRRLSIRSAASQHPADRTPPVTPSPTTSPQGLTTEISSPEPVAGHGERDVVDLLQRMASA